MANPECYPREATVRITHGIGTATWRENLNGKLTRVEFDFSENHAMYLSIAISNGDPDTYIDLLSASCNVWTESVTGPISEGDRIELGYYRVDSDTIDWYFDGYVVSAIQSNDDNLVVTGYDPSKAFDNKRVSRTIYKNFKDSEVWSITNTDGYRYIQNFTPNNVVKPLNSLKLWNQEIYRHFGAGTLVPGSYWNLCEGLGNQSIQSFIAEGEFLTAIECYCHTKDYDNGHPTHVPYYFYGHIYTDSNNLPDTCLGSPSFNPKNTGDHQHLWASFPGGPIKLVKGARYWIVFQASAITGELWIDCEYTSGENTQSFKYYDAGGLGWVTASGLCQHVGIKTQEMEDIDVTDYSIDETVDKIQLYRAVRTPPVEKAILTYFYNTLTLEEVLKSIILLDTGLKEDVNTNCDRIFNTYSTQGRSIGDCLRELLDVFENSGTWNGRQHVMAFYRDASATPGIPRIKIGKRLDTTNDSEVATFSDQSGGVDDDEVKILSVNLEVTIKNRADHITVTGEDPQGYPIIAVRSDQPKTGSFHVKMKGLSETKEIVDATLKTYSDVDKRAWLELDSIQRDVWEGNIILTGHHFGLIDFDKTSSSFGSGKIIKLNYSPMGIAALKMKVTRAIFKSDGTTEVYLNNIDTVTRNRLTQGLGTTDKLESFAAPVGPVNTIAVQFFANLNIYTVNDVYCKLYDINNTLIKPQTPVLCIKTVNSRYNACCYNATFELGNAYSEWNNIRYIELYHGVTQLVKYDLKGTTDGIPKDLSFRKTMTSRLIVEVIGKAS